jgi:hypothetical protein
MQGSRQWVQAVIKKIHPLPHKVRADQLRIFTVNSKDTISWRMTWECSARDGLYNGQITILPRKTSTYAT